MSVAGRARIAAAQRKRWAQFHKSKKAAAVPEVAKPKRRISEEGMKKDHRRHQEKMGSETGGGETGTSRDKESHNEAVGWKESGGKGSGRGGEEASLADDGESAGSTSSIAGAKVVGLTPR